MGSLQEVDGGFNLQSTDGKFSCNTFHKLKEDGTIKGTYHCKEVTSNPTTANGKSGTATSTGGGASSTSSTGAAVANMVNVPVAGVAAAFYALAQLL